MVAVARVSPETLPAEPTVATAVLLLVQLPPPEMLDRDTAEPMQTVNGPVIGAGGGLTVNTNSATQPVDNVYLMIDVPAMRPVTTPVVLIAAMAPSVLLHTPPAVASLSDVAPPTQTL